MAPAFHSDRGALLFGLGLLCLILLPIGIQAVGPVSRQSMYRGLYPAFGAKGTIDEAIYGGPAHSDVVLLGSSTMLAGLPPGAVEQYFSPRLGRPAIVRELVLQRSGPDKMLVMLRDYLRSHTTKLIVAALPWRTYATRGPSSDLYTVMRYGEFAHDFRDVSTGDSVKVYSEMVVGGPLEAVYELRANRDLPAPYDDVERSKNRGREGPFERDSLQAPASLADKCLVTIGSAGIRNVGKSSESYDYLRVFYRKLADLATDNGTPFLLVNFPEYKDYGDASIPVALDLGACFRKDQAMIAMSCSDLFGNASRKTFDRFFRDDVHLNANGCRLFDSVALPAMFRVYESQSGAKAR